MSVAEANVLTRRGDTGSGSRDVNEWGALVYAAIPKRRQATRWLVVAFPLEDTTPTIGYESQEERQEVQATWNRILQLPNIGWQGVESLTRASNPTASRTGLSELLRPQVPRAISLAEARELALEVLRSAKRELQEERTQDARFLASLLEDVEDS